jgi:ribosomal protein S14
MTFLRKISSATGFLPAGTDEFGKINLCRAAFTATRAAQAGPNFATLNEASVRIQHGLFDDLPRRKFRQLTADGAAPGTQATFHAVVDLFFSQIHVFK